MKRIAGFAVALVLVLGTVAGAQVSCGDLQTTLGSNTTAQGLMRSPAHYEGTIATGALAPGTWRVDIDDTGWPASGSARRNKIKTFYTYDAQARVFRGTFGPSLVDFQFVSGGLTYAGTATVVFTANDSNRNGVLNNGELNNQTVSASFNITCGMGTAACGGNGLLAGSASLDTVLSPLAGGIYTTPCVTGVEPSTWSLLKRLYRD